MVQLDSYPLSQGCFTAASWNPLSSSQRSLLQVTSSPDQVWSPKHVLISLPATWNPDWQVKVHVVSVTGGPSQLTLPYSGSIKLILHGSAVGYKNKN